MAKTTTGKFNSTPAPAETPATATTSAGTTATKPAPAESDNPYSRPIPRDLWKYVL